MRSKLTYDFTQLKANKSSSQSFSWYLPLSLANYSLPISFHLRKTIALCSLPVFVFVFVFTKQSLKSQVGGQFYSIIGEQKLFTVSLFFTLSLTLFLSSSLSLSSPNSLVRAKLADIFIPFEANNSSLQSLCFCLCLCLCLCVCHCVR